MFVNIFLIAGALMVGVVVADSLERSRWNALLVWGCGWLAAFVCSQFVDLTGVRIGFVVGACAGVLVLTGIPRPDPSKRGVTDGLLDALPNLSVNAVLAGTVAIVGLVGGGAWLATRPPPAPPPPPPPKPSVVVKKAPKGPGDPRYKPLLRALQTELKSREATPGTRDDLEDLAWGLRNAERLDCTGASEVCTLGGFAAVLGELAEGQLTAEEQGADLVGMLPEEARKAPMWEPVEALFSPFHAASIGGAPEFVPSLQAEIDQSAATLSRAIRRACTAETSDKVRALRMAAALAGFHRSLVEPHALDALFADTNPNDRNPWRYVDPDALKACVD